MATLKLESERWFDLLFDAALVPPNLSVSYVPDLRYLFLRRMANELESAGLPVVRQKLPGLFGRKNASISSHTPVSHWSPAKLLDAEFCYGYGFDDYSFRALNYLVRPKPARPFDFVKSTNRLMLGNFAIRIARAPSGFYVEPPPDLIVTGIAEVGGTKSHSYVAWLGVQFDSNAIDPSTLADIELLEPPNLWEATPRPNHSPYISRFAQYFSTSPYGEMSAEEEGGMRLALGYPAKGNTGVREQILYESAKSIFGNDNIKRRYRGKELNGLELDVWIPYMHLAFEYQGEQHYCSVDHWHGKNGFEKQQKRDRDKVAICKSLGIRLLLFNINSDLDRNSIIELLRKHWML